MAKREVTWQVLHLSCGLVSFIMLPNILVALYLFLATSSLIGCSMAISEEIGPDGVVEIVETGVRLPSRTIEKKIAITAETTIVRVDVQGMIEPTGFYF